ncbi:MAG: hypothetical protein BGO63_10530 [Candidatus Accumulibacter sp. 66-26]|nr:MAG: hypothetical protein BGO63_10530 [Candidatus Accumulibacter sp. 66-26]
MSGTGPKDMSEKNTTLIARMQARAATSAPSPSDGEQPRKKVTAPGVLADFAGQVNAAVMRAEKAEAELERLKTTQGSSEELAEARRKLTEAEEALATARNSQPPRRAKLDDLHEVAGRRRKLTAEQYEELRENLKNNPLAHPVTVRIRQGGGYEIISGNNRTAIYRELGRDEIDVTIQDLTDDETDRTAFYSNLLQPTLTDYEKYLGFKNRMARMGYNQTQVAIEAGVRQNYVSFLMTFDGLPPEAREVIATKPSIIGGATVEKLAKLAKAGKGAKVIEAIEKLSTGEIKTEADAVHHANTVVARPTSRPEPVVIRQGRHKYCELIHSDKTVRLSFANQDEASAVMAELKNILETRAKAAKEQ